MINVETSPLPWHVVYIDGDQELVSLADSTGRYIASGLTEQDAKLICDAVSHEGSEVSGV